jgi:N-glycosylase/DNA lyase
MRRAIRAGAGIRILKQDLWETVVSFIISQNNNIPRIKGCIEALCSQFGDPVTAPDGSLWYDIPRPEVLACLKREDLDGCRLGYRAPYLIETARQIIERGGMKAVEQQLREAEDPIAALQDFAGVGPKVASCIALFGVGRCDAFPIDVWMRRAMHTVYGIEGKRTAEMQKYAREHFGRHGGFAQQYLFCYMRGL